MDHARRQDGQVVVLVALLMPILLGFCGLAIDVGMWHVEREKLQTAADAAALAGAAKLPGSAGAARAAAVDYARRNVSDADVTTRTPYGGDGERIEVVVARRAPTYFATIFGLGTVAVTARAVGTSSGARTPYAIFAHATACADTALTINGNAMSTDGAVHSNGHVNVNGSNIHTGPASGGGPNGCEVKVDGSNIDFDGDPVPATDPTQREWPAWFATSDFSCTYSAASFVFARHNRTIPSGVYCATSEFVINGNNISGNITVIAPKIVVNGNSGRLTPYAHDVLFFATPGSTEMNLNGNGFAWEGIIFHPEGKVNVNGNAGASLTGMIEARQVEVNGNSFTMVGAGPATGNGKLALVE